tara:strand:+ start:3417 stop:3719 length:303 start_codon:yes stop_codon:yes gene_type:complete
MQTYREAYEATQRKIDELHIRYEAGEIERSDFVEERLALGAEASLLASQDRFLNQWYIDREEWESLSDKTRKTLLEVGRVADKYENLRDQLRNWMEECPI